MEKTKCAMESKGKCKSDYNYNNECDGINVPEKCPYKLKEKEK